MTSTINGYLAVFVPNYDDAGNFPNKEDDLDYNRWMEPFLSEGEALIGVAARIATGNWKLDHIYKSEESVEYTQQFMEHLELSVKIAKLRLEKQREDRKLAIRRSVFESSLAHFLKLAPDLIDRARNRWLDELIGLYPEYTNELKSMHIPKAS